MDQASEVTRFELEGLALAKFSTAQTKKEGVVWFVWQPVYFGGFWRELSTFSDAELEARLR